jgi:SAM-dependent methyltransferase
MISGLSFQNGKDFVEKCERNIHLSKGEELENSSSNNKENLDIVLALEVIEHVLSPKCFIEGVSKIVKPGGVLILRTPNYAPAKRFGNEWLGFNMSFEHIYFYSVDLLMEMMSKEGLCLEYSESSKHLGASQGCGFLERQIERLRTIFFSLKKLVCY